MNGLSKPPRALAVLLSGLTMGAWSPVTHACAAEPLIASVCLMGLNPGSRLQTMNNTYMLAQGQSLAVSQYAALYSLLGTTFGGNGSTTFNLPDLRGKVVVGFDPRDATRTVGANGGSASMQLTVAQLPPHAVPIANLPVTLTNLQATTTLTSLAATANLSGVVIKGPATGLTIKAASTSNGQSSPAGNYLGKSGGGSSNIYSNTATPDATLNAGAIDGELALTVKTGTTAPVTITGNASTTVTGAGVANGTSGSVGAGVAVPTMPPYLVLPYYIAYSGIYPSGN
ncbi:phage tail protein [Massilia sp. S19_KUP03_FR1]|uniref:phage tail protein n=1 Tax=Massilia sp. S19_KUP03_FR1 TaxID=3025503 RepID=UPI002FCD83D4